MDAAATGCSKAASRENARAALEVLHALAATGRASLRFLSVSVSDGVITLRGRVSSYYLKQVAQTAALRVGGVRLLSNEVEVA